MSQPPPAPPALPRAEDLASRSGHSLAALVVRRPVGTMLLALALFLAGLLAFRLLPVAPLPRVDMPAITVTARVPGADPETMATTVAAPLERQLGQISGVSEMTSQSTQGSASITIVFDLNRDVTAAARDVQAAINSAIGDLPSDMPAPPTYRKVNPADAPIMILALTSATIAGPKLYDLADTIVVQRLSQIDGVAQVTVSGAEKPALRVRADQGRLTAMGLGLDDIRTTITSANVLRPKGVINDGDSRSLTIGSNDQILTAQALAPLVVRAADGRVIRLSQLGSVQDSVENERVAGWFNRDRAVLIIIQKQAEANVIETVERVKAALPQINGWLPAGADVRMVVDRTPTIRAGVKDVELTMLLTILLVIGLIWLALGQVTPTLAAGITVPLSLAGTFGGMWLLGYSIDNITLMALIVSVGFVVDDAIVMIENIARYVEAGLPPLQAAVRGAREISFTVFSISLSLIAVFIPLLFMGGIVGRFFRTFAVTLTLAIVVSLVVSLTVTPSLYGHLLARRQKALGRTVGDSARDNHTLHWGERLTRRLRRIYLRRLHWVLRHPRIMGGVMVATIVVTVALYNLIPKGLFPQQDTGMILGLTDARNDISIDVMKPLQMKVMEIVLADPAVQGLGSFVGSGGGAAGSGQGRVFISLKPRDQRDASVDEVIARLRPKLGRIPGITTYLIAMQDLRFGGRSGKAQYQFALWSDSLADLRFWTPKLIDRLRELKQITDVGSDMETAGQQIRVVVDRDAAGRLGVDVTAVDQLLQSAFAQRQVSTLYTQRNQYHIVLEATPRDLSGPDALERIYIRSASGTPVPLTAFATLGMEAAPVSVNHQGPFPVTTVTFNLPIGTPLGAAMTTIQQAAADIGMPPSLHPEFAGNAKIFTDSFKSQPLLIATALLAIYIVLGMLYESTLHPLTILSTLPSAGIGALVALILTGFELSLISFIGVILLMGIVKKNGIMLVDFAIDARRRGHGPVRAILGACRARFRPIGLTTLTAVLGAIPLAIGGGVGAELRQPLGITIVGGLVLSQLLTLYTTPVMYLALDRLSQRLATRRARRRAEKGLA